MGYIITWDELEKICRKLNMERQGKTSVWKRTGSDGKMRTCIIHAKHKGNIGPGLLNKIAKEQLLFDSVEDLHNFHKSL